MTFPVALSYVTACLQQDIQGADLLRSELPEDLEVTGPEYAQSAIIAFRFLIEQYSSSIEAGTDLKSLIGHYSNNVKTLGHPGQWVAAAESADLLVERPDQLWAELRNSYGLNGASLALLIVMVAILNLAAHHLNCSPEEAAQRVLLTSASNATEL